MLGSRSGVERRRRGRRKGGRQRAPRIMVEPFAREFLGADRVVGTELEVRKNGKATGFMVKLGVLVGEHKKLAVVKELGDAVPNVGMGNRASDFNFMSICKTCLGGRRERSNS